MIFVKHLVQGLTHSSHFTNAYFLPSHSPVPSSLPISPSTSLPYSSKPPSTLLQYHFPSLSPSHHQEVSSTSSSPAFSPLSSASLSLPSSKVFAHSSSALSTQSSQAFPSPGHHSLDFKAERELTGHQLQSLLFKEEETESDSLSDVLWDTQQVGLEEASTHTFLTLLTILWSVGNLLSRSPTPQAPLALSWVSSHLLSFLHIHSHGACSSLFINQSIIPLEGPLSGQLRLYLQVFSKEEIQAEKR